MFNERFPLLGIAESKLWRMNTIISSDFETLGYEKLSKELGRGEWGSPKVDENETNVAKVMTKRRLLKRCWMMIHERVIDRNGES